MVPMPPESPAARPGSWPRWVGYAAVIVAAFLCGAVIATAVTLRVVDDRSQDRHIVTVFMNGTATAEQKAAVESALSRLYPTGSVRLEGGKRTLERLREQVEDVDGTTGAGESPEAPESFRVEVAGTSIDCGPLAPVAELTGVRLVTVGRPPAAGRPNALLWTCP
jgi:cell division protein FtsX